MQDEQNLKSGGFLIPGTSSLQQNGHHRRIITFLLNTD